MTSYYLGHVEQAEKRIREAVPDAIIARTDYHFGLSVANAARTKGFIVFQPPRDDIGQREIKSSFADIEQVIKVLRG